MEETCDHEFRRFSIQQETVKKLAENNSYTTFHQSGRIQAIAASLETNLDIGISGQEMELRRRRQVFGSNGLTLSLENNCKHPASLHFGRLISDSIKDSTVILLLCCATLSLLLGIKRNGFEQGILDGAMVFVVISSVVCISSLFRFVKNWINELLVSKRTSRRAAVKVMRDGRVRQIAVSEVVVGDVVCLQTGDQVPADGLFVHGKNLKLDDGDDKLPCIFTGAKVVGGECSMLVTSVGENTETSMLMKLLSKDGRINRQDNKESKLQISVDRMGSRMEKIWLSLSLLVIVVQVLGCFAWGDDDHDPEPKGGVRSTVKEIMGEVVTKFIRRQGATSHNRYVEMLSILVFVSRDGLLPIGLFICLAYASKKLPCFRATARNLPVCSSLGLVTAICTGKTSDLSLDHANMAELWIATDNSFIKSTSADVLDALREAIATTSYDEAAVDDDDALLLWAKEFLDVDGDKMKQNCTVEAFNISKNRAGLLLKWNGSESDGDNSVHIHWRGSPEIILSMCTHYLDRHGTLQTLDEHKRDVFNNFIRDIDANHHSLRCISFACKRVEQQNEEEIIELTECGLTWLGLVRLKSPYASEVKQAIEDCRESAGIKIKLIVEDDINIARLIAINSGLILKSGAEDHSNGYEAAVIEASVFRSSSEETRSLMVDNVRVMANASPLDKLLMVQCLKQKGEVVAVTGMCTRDAPSLKEADVGVSIGERSAQFARDCSDIVILDQNFATIAANLKWGRCVCNNIRKFIQLHLTVNAAAFGVNLVAAIFFGEIPLEPFQLLWVNLIMDVLGALALAAPVSLREQLPAHATAAASASPLANKTLWRNIILQVLYQVFVLSVTQLKGKELLQVQANKTDLKAIVFNSFVLCQVFVLINAREIEALNIFEGKGLHQNLWFLVIVGFIFILDIAVIEMVTVVTHGTRVDLKHWCVCIGIAVMTLPTGLVAKCIPMP